MRTFFQIHTDQAPGDVLIFLPGSFHRFSGPSPHAHLRIAGQEDIESLEKSVRLFANQLPQDAMEVC